MSADPTKNAEGTDHDGGDSDGSTDIKALREAAKSGKQARDEADTLKRENAFLRAGVDVDSKVGSMLFKTYEGDLTDVEALKAEWAELKPASTGNENGRQEDPETAPPPPGFQDPSGQQQHREGTQGSGSPAGEQPKSGPDPFDSAFETFHNRSALPLEDRQEQAMSSVLAAYFQGDKRVMFDRNAHLAAARHAASEDVDPSA